jgi:hypothetical protein
VSGFSRDPQAPDEPGDVDVLLAGWRLLRRWPACPQPASQNIAVTRLQTGGRVGPRKTFASLRGLRTCRATLQVSFSQPKVLFDQPYAFGPAITFANYEVAPDGQRFLMIRNESSSGRLNVVLNWQEELKRLVPPR